MIGNLHVWAQKKADKKKKEKRKIKAFVYSKTENMDKGRFLERLSILAGKYCNPQKSYDGEEFSSFV